MKLNDVVIQPKPHYHTTEHKTTIKKPKKIKPLDVMTTDIPKKRHKQIKPLHFYMSKVYKSAVV